MSTQPQSHPEYTAVPEHICNHCGDMIENASSFEDEFDPRNATEDTGGGYIHEHCIAARRANDLSAEERFAMVKLVAAMLIIQETSHDLLKKMDLDKFGEFDLLTMQESVNDQLLLLNPEPCVFAEPQLFFMREQDIINGAVALGKAQVAASVEFENIQKSDLFQGSNKKLMVKISADRLDFITRAHQGMREASHVS